MLDPTRKVAVKPEVVLLERLLTEVAEGKLRVPRFQRGFVWRPEQMLHLYDSIERGYPIGSILVWQTGQRLYSQPDVAGIDIPPPPADEPVSYLLDGNQRLSTLFGTLAHRPAHPGEDPREDDWWIYRVLGEAALTGPRFRHWAGPGQPPPDYLPMQAILRTVDFLRYSRRLAREIDDYEDLLEEAEQLTQQIRSYEVAVIRLKGGDLSHAVEAFTRLNSAGQQITPLEMISALTYRPEVAENLNSRITGIQQRVGAGGFGDIPTETVFHAVLAVAGHRDVGNPDWGAVAERLGDLLDGAAVDAEAALHRAVRFLRYEAGVPLAWLVPVPLQVVLLARFFHLVPEPDLAKVRELVRWFWATSWSGVLGEADTSQAVRAIDQIEEFAQGIGELAVTRHVAQPFPAWFDPASGRTRAFMLWELRAFRYRLGLDGKVIDSVDLLARLKGEAYRRVLAAEQELLFSPGNHLMLPTPPGVPIVDALVDHSPGGLFPKILASHGISAEAIAHLRATRPEPEPDQPVEADQAATDDELSEMDGLDELSDQLTEAAAEAEQDAHRRAEAERQFIQTRARQLARGERAFMQEMGIDYVTVAYEKE
jgi:hypothetical protein